MAAPDQAGRRQPPDLPAAARELAGQPGHLPRRRRRQRAGQQRAGLRRGVGHGAHRGRPDPARGDAAGRPDHPRRLPDPARPGGGLPGRAAPGAAVDAAHHFAGSDGGVARGLGRGQRRAGRGRQPAAGDHRQLRARGPDPDRRRAGAPAGAGHRLRAGDQHAGGDPARPERRPVLPPRLRRLARGRHARRRLAAGRATDAGARRHRRAGGEARRGRPAERPWRPADHLRPPHPGRAGRVRRPARLPAGRHHGPALGRQHQVRRAVRQRRQPVLRPGRGPLVPLDPGQPGRGASSPARTCRPTSARSRPAPRPGSCCRPWPARRRPRRR